MPPAAPAQNSQQALSNLQGFTGSMQTPDQAAAAANNQFQVGQQQQQVQGLRTALQNTTQMLNNVAPSVMGRTAHSLVTDAQANRQIANEQAPLNQQFGVQNQAYGNAQQDYQNALSQAESRANANLGFQTQQQSYLQGIYSDLASKEQQAAALAEQKREADLSAATARASGSGGANPSYAGLSGLGGAGGAAPQAFAKGTNPQDAVKQMFQGYSVAGARPGYTEDTVIPVLRNLLATNNPKASSDLIDKSVRDLVYGYRKTAFGQ